MGASRPRRLPERKSSFKPERLITNQKTKVHFVDCVIAVTASAEDIPVATSDQGFRKFTDVRVENQ